MMLALLVVLSVSSCAFAQNDCCSMEDRFQVQRMWKSVWSAEFTGRRIALAKAVFEDLFEDQPGAKDLFGRVNVADMNSNEFRAHCVRVVNGLDTSINLLTNPAVLDKQLGHLGAQHAKRPVVAAQFDAMARSFADVMPQVSMCFNVECWSDCFKRITDGIVAGL